MREPKRGSVKNLSLSFAGRAGVARAEAGDGLAVLASMVTLEYRLVNAVENSNMLAFPSCACLDGNIGVSLSDRLRRPVQCNSWFFGARAAFVVSLAVLQCWCHEAKTRHRAAVDVVCVQLCSARSRCTMRSMSIAHV